MAQDSNRLTLAPLRADQYRQVAEWEFGPQPEDTDWERYAVEMNMPQWGHLAMYKDGHFVGCLSLERIDRQTVAYHVVTARKKIHPNELAQVLLKTADDLFSLGYGLLVAQIPKEKRAAARLAIRCGMTETMRNESIRQFILTRLEHQNG